MELFGRKPKKIRSDGYFRVEAAAGAAQDVSSSYQTPSLIASGIEASQVSILSALTNLLVALMYTKVPAIIGRMGSRKRAVLILALLDVMTWLPLVSVMFFVGAAVAPRSLAALWIASSIPSRLILPVRDSWLADTISDDAVGHQLGLRAAISAAAYIGVFYLMVRLMDVFGADIFKGFAAVCLVAFIASSVKAISYWHINDAEGFGEKQPRFGFFDFLEETKREGLGRFVLYVSLFNFAVYLCSPLFAVYMVKYLDFSPMIFAMVIASEFIARAVTSGFWGRHADRIGALPILKAVSFLIPFIPILWLVSPNVPYLVSLQVFSGVVWAGFDVCSQSLIYKTVPTENRTRYMAYQSSLTTLFRAGGALLGAVLLGVVFPIHGYRILGLFLLSGILRFVVARAMLPRMRRLREIADLQPTGFLGLGSPFREDARDKRSENALIGGGKSRWYYPAPPLQRIVATKEYVSPLVPKPFYLHCGNWWAGRKPLKPIGTIKSNIGSSNSKKGLYYHPEDWDAFVKSHRK